MKSITYKGNNIKLENEQIYFNGVPVPVRQLKGYTYKLNKTCISADGNAPGLYGFIVECIELNFMLVFVDQIIEHMEKLTAAA